MKILTPDRYKDLEKLMALNDGLSCEIYTGDYEVFRIFNEYFVFERPEYGGEPQFLKNFYKPDMNTIIDYVYDLR